MVHETRISYEFTNKESHTQAIGDCVFVNSYVIRFS